MSSEEVARSAGEPRPTLDLTDPKAMRALAHPVRIALLEMLGVAGTLTATQASEALGESPANCAFHLRTLAKYGFIEEAGGGRGRERPWRIVVENLRLSRSRQSSPEARTAAATLESVWLERWLARIRRVIVGGAHPAGWEGGSEARQSMRFLTVDEVARMTEEMQEVVNRYRDRPGDPADMPAGALPVEVGIFAYPLVELAGLVAPDDKS
jgi:predicted transcriptional regulator